jgi:hypothetical protein
MFRWFALRLNARLRQASSSSASKRETRCYLRGFFVWAPSPTPLAWFGHHLPAWLLRAMLVFMFVAEWSRRCSGFFAGVPTADLVRAACAC